MKIALARRLAAVKVVAVVTFGAALAEGKGSAVISRDHRVKMRTALLDVGEDECKGEIGAA